MCLPTPCTPHTVCGAWTGQAQQTLPFGKERKQVTHGHNPLEILESSWTHIAGQTSGGREYSFVRADLSPWE